MKIVIDARLYGIKHRGIGRYVTELIKGIIESSSSHEYLLLIDPETANELPRLPNSIKTIEAPWRVYSFAEQIKLPLLLYKIKADLIHFPHFSAPFFCPIPFVITIHDLILHHAPAERATKLPFAYYWLKVIAYRALIKRLVYKAKRIITISTAVANDIENYYPGVSDKIKVIHLAAARFDKPSTIKKETTYVLMVGAAYPHKNLKRAIRAVAITRGTHPELKLILVGRIDHFAVQIRRWVVRNNYQEWVQFTGEVSDKEINSLYANAFVYLLPSLQEGFGLGCLEALSFNIPVIVSDIPVFHEILGRAAFFVDPNSEEHIAKGIIKAMDSDSRQLIIVEGNRLLPQYSWEKTIQSTLEQYDLMVE